MHKKLIILVVLLFLLVGFNALAEKIYFQEEKTDVTGDTLTINIEYGEKQIEAGKFPLIIKNVGGLRQEDVTVYDYSTKNPLSPQPKIESSETTTKIHLSPGIYTFAIKETDKYESYDSSTEFQYFMVMVDGKIKTMWPSRISVDVTEGVTINIKVKEKPAESTAPTTPSVKYLNLQIGLINGTYSCTDVVCKENEPPHIVYVPRMDFEKSEGGMDLFIPFNGFKEGEKMFVGINKMPDLDTAKNSEIDYPFTSPFSIDFSEFKNGKGFSTKESGFAINKWDGSTFSIYACQQKEAGGKKCDLTGYDKDGKPVYAKYSSYVEPNYEAASIVIQLEPAVEEQPSKPIVEPSPAPAESSCVKAMKNAKLYESLIDSKAGSMPKNLLRALIEVEGWNNAQSKIEEKATNYEPYSNYVKGLSCSDGTVILSKTGDAKATWNTALTVARYRLEEAKVKCTSIEDEFTREEFVPKVLAWYRVFTENYDKDETSADYCKPRIGVPATGVPATPPPVTPEVSLKCKKCSSIDQCLACIDFKFVGGVFK